MRYLLFGIIFIIILSTNTVFAQQIKVPVKKEESQEKKAVVSTPKPANSDKQILKICPNLRCTIKIDGEVKGTVNADGVLKVEMNKGVFLIEAISTENSKMKYSTEYTVGEVNVEKLLKIDFTELLSKEADAKKQIEEQKKIKEDEVKNQQLLIHLELDSWNKAKAENTLESYKKYMSDFPQGIHIAEARAKITETEESDMKNNPDKYFMKAVKDHNYDLIMKLADYGANVNQYEIKDTIFSELPDVVIKNCITALFVGAYMKQSESTKLLNYLETLFKHGANANQESDFTYKDCKYYALGGYMSVDNYSPNTVLEIIKLFIKYGYKINIDDGRILMSLTVFHDPSNPDKNCIPIITYLLEKGADPKITQTCTVPMGKNKDMKVDIWSAFKMAKVQKKEDLVELFKKY